MNGLHNGLFVNDSNGLLNGLEIGNRPGLFDAAKTKVLPGQVYVASAGLNSASATSGASVTPSYPAGNLPGDLLLLHTFSKTAGISTHTPDNTWTPKSFVAGSGYAQGIFYKYVTTPLTFNATVGFSSGGDLHMAQIYCIRNASLDPKDVFEQNLFINGAPTVLGPTLVATRAKSMAFLLAWSANGATPTNLIGARTDSSSGWELTYGVGSTLGSDGWMGIYRATLATIGSYTIGGLITHTSSGTLVDCFIIKSRKP